MPFMLSVVAYRVQAGIASTVDIYQHFTWPAAAWPLCCADVTSVMNACDSSNTTAAVPHHLHSPGGVGPVGSLSVP